ncbi:cation transporter HKT1;3-like isoform X1 [Arachis stenosperma]|uniref:cation transporter HKT1;3-like isoform X1 n=1 Tax=Arachis stenosperma TaxID=217475 RepID=UPI0025ACA7C8|nr:cation transporter HKT1;3-like isoform X1 [Arachis stenosperma]
MKMFAWFGKKLQHLCSVLCGQLTLSTKSLFFLAACLCRFLLQQTNPLLVQIIYFVSLSSIGFGFLKIFKPRTSSPSFTPRNLDLFFTSVSSATVSSMSTVEMEVFSNPQLITITILMFVGGEVFTSMVGLHFIRSRLKTELDKIAASHARLSTTQPIIVDDQIELGSISKSKLDASKPENDDVDDDGDGEVIVSVYDETLHSSFGATSENLRYLSMKHLGFVILGYLVVVHVIGVLGVSLYIEVISSAKMVLKNKGLNRFTFSVFTVISTFASCGFVPTNENMVVFRKNSGMLLMLVPQVLLGNTLYPCCLRFCVWLLGKFNYKKRETRYLLKKTEEVGYKHLLSREYSIFLVATVFGFIVVQIVVFCSMDWNSQGLVGMNVYEKFVGVLFQSVNSRHSGETIVDLSILSSAILVLFVVMMYLPPYTSFLPLKDHEKDSEIRKRKGKLMENLIFSQLSYLVIFVILVCITERKNLKEDPLNFNVLNIVIEVISAYGNVGFSTGYSCKRQLHPEANCEDKWFGFVGKWSDEGKIILILVMFFGRLKKFNMNGGKAWKLL